MKKNITKLQKKSSKYKCVCVCFFDRHLIMNTFSASADHSASFRTYIEAAIAASLLATLVLLRSKASHNSEPPSNNTEATLKVILKTKAFLSVQLMNTVPESVLRKTSKASEQVCCHDIKR